jgi:hypothetical protein
MGINVLVARSCPILNPLNNRWVQRMDLIVEGAGASADTAGNKI